MRGGQLSNAIPRRVLVTTEVFIIRTPTIKKVLGLIPVAGEDVEYNRIALNKLWWFGSKNEILLEVAGIGFTEKETEQLMSDLDNAGTNPFNYAHAYESVSDLVRHLPYRPEVYKVMDIPSRALRYGSWYMGLE
jgi:hypothetical protein